MDNHCPRNGRTTLSDSDGLDLGLCAIITQHMLLQPRLKLFSLTMGDNESINSDCESIRAKDAAAKVDTTQFVIQLPPEGHDRVAASSSSTIAAGAVDQHELICADANNNNDDYSAAGSSISSFVPTSWFDKKSVQQ